jgi:hypothetical protein
VPSCLGLWRPLQLLSKWVQLSWQQTLVSSPWCWFYRHAKCKSCRHLQPRFQRKAWEARQGLAVSGSLWATPMMVMCEAVRVKLKMQWRPHEVRYAREVKHLWRKASGNEARQPRTEALCTATNKPHGWGCPAAPEYHHVPQMLDTELQNLIFTLLVSHPSLLVSYFSLWAWECVPYMIACLTILTFFLILQRLTAKCCLESQRELWTWTLSNAQKELLRLWGLLEMDWIHFALWHAHKCFGSWCGMLRFGYEVSPQKVYVLKASFPATVCNHWGVIGSWGCWGNQRINSLMDS